MPRRSPEPRANEWIVDILKAIGKTQAALAQHMGLEPERISEIIRGIRRVQFSEADDLASFLRISVPDLRARLIDKEAVGAPLGVVLVVDFAEAGKPQETTERPAADWYEAPVASIKAFASFPQFGLEVRGTSINRRYPPGSVAVFVRYSDLKRTPRAGETVVLHRATPDGVEVSIRELRAAEDGVLWLWPASTDPLHQQPLPAATEGQHIHGLVIGSYQPENVKP